MQDVLFVTSQIPKAKRPVVNHLKKKLLDRRETGYGPSGLTDRCHVEAIPRLEELPLLVAESVAEIIRLLDTFVLMPASVLRLLCLYDWCECQFSKASPLPSNPLGARFEQRFQVGGILNHQHETGRINFEFADSSVRRRWSTDPRAVSQELSIAAHARAGG